LLHSTRFSSAFLPASRFPPNTIFVGAPTTPYLSTCRRLGKVVGLCRRCSPRFPRHTPIDREASQYATLFRVARGSQLGRTHPSRHSPSDRRSPRCVSHAARSSRESRAWSSQCRRQLGGTGTLFPDEQDSLHYECWMGGKIKRPIQWTQYRQYSGWWMSSDSVCEEPLGPSL
jgi:hypothetical protein